MQTRLAVGRWGEAAAVLISCHSPTPAADCRCDNRACVPERLISALAAALMLQLYCSYAALMPRRATNVPAAGAQQQTKRTTDNVTHC